MEDVNTGLQMQTESSCPPFTMLTSLLNHFIEHTFISLHLYTVKQPKVRTSHITWQNPQEAWKLPETMSAVKTEFKSLCSWKQKSNHPHILYHTVTIMFIFHIYFYHWDIQSLLMQFANVSNKHIMFFQIIKQIFDTCGDLKLKGTKIYTPWANQLSLCHWGMLVRICKWSAIHTQEECLF